MDHLMKALPTDDSSHIFNAFGSKSCTEACTEAYSRVCSGAGPRVGTVAKRSRTSFDMANLMSSIETMSYQISHIIPAALAVMKWVNKNPGYNYAKSYKGWKNEIRCKFSTLVVQFPLSKLKLIADKYRCPTEFRHIQSHLASNRYLTCCDDITGIVKLTIDYTKLFDFIQERGILVGYGRKLYLEKQYFDEVDLFEIHNNQNQKIKHRRYCY